MQQSCRKGQKVVIPRDSPDTRGIYIAFLIWVSNEFVLACYTGNLHQLHKPIKEEDWQFKELINLSQS